MCDICINVYFYFSSQCIMVAHLAGYDLSQQWQNKIVLENVFEYFF